MSWRDSLGQHMRHMTPEQATASLRRIQLRIGLADQPEVRRLTGLPKNRVSARVVVAVCERLAKRAAGDGGRKFDPTEQREV